MSLFAPLVFTGSALSRSRAEISFSALRQAVSRGKMAFGFFRILTQTLTHTGIRVHGTSGTDRASERGFPSPQGRKSAGMSPHRIQTAAHNPKVVGSSPASATKQKRHPFYTWDSGPAPSGQSEKSRLSRCPKMAPWGWCSSRMGILSLRLRKPHTSQKLWLRAGLFLFLILPGSSPHFEPPLAKKRLFL